MELLIVINCQFFQGVIRNKHTKKIFLPIKMLQLIQIGDPTEIIDETAEENPTENIDVTNDISTDIFGNELKENGLGLNWMAQKSRFFILPRKMPKYLLLLCPLQ